jgi:hypothetical protein
MTFCVNLLMAPGVSSDVNIRPGYNCNGWPLRRRKSCDLTSRVPLLSFPHFSVYTLFESAYTGSLNFFSNGRLGSIFWLNSSTVGSEDPDRRHGLNLFGFSSLSRRTNHPSSCHHLPNPRRSPYTSLHIVSHVGGEESSSAHIEPRMSAARTDASRRAVDTPLWAPTPLARVTSYRNS